MVVTAFAIVNLPNTKSRTFFDIVVIATNTVVGGAIIDTITQRGGFRGEELSTIGQLRDQCAQAVQVVESFKQEEAEEE